MLSSSNVEKIAASEQKQMLQKNDIGPHTHLHWGTDKKNSIVGGSLKNRQVQMIKKKSQGAWSQGKQVYIYSYSAQTQTNVESCHFPKTKNWE